MARQKKTINKEEVDEIIELTIKELGGLKSKLSYNKVWNFNKKLVKDKIMRANGELFSEYGYTFWASHYKGEDYYGKAQIDKLKSLDDIVIVGESFSRDTQDLLLLVDKYHSKPDELAKRLVKIFERDRKKIAALQQQNSKMNSEIASLREKQATFEKGFVTLFYNSIYVDNSLTDVMSIKKSCDSYVADELKNMFNHDENKISKLLEPKNTNTPKDSSVIDFHDKAKAKAELEELF
ncbi:hypothetical protein ACEE21_08070 [Clostridium baratii]